METEGLSRRGKWLVFAAFLTWFVLFGAGLVVNSAPYREALNGTTSVVAWLWAAFVVLTIYTPTNIALLAVSAGLLGALGATARLHKPKTDQGGEEAPWLDTVNPYLSALIRGFLVYLILISGILVLIEDPFDTPTPEQYVRLAGFVSVFSFIANYNPETFGNFFERIATALESRLTRTPGR